MNRRRLDCRSSVVCWMRAILADAEVLGRLPLGEEHDETFVEVVDGQSQALGVQLVMVRTYRAKMEKRWSSRVE